jgi:hypothetical protein
MHLSYVLKLQLDVQDVNVWFPSLNHLAYVFLDVQYMYCCVYTCTAVLHMSSTASLQTL